MVELEIADSPDFNPEVSDMFADMLLTAKYLIQDLSSVKQINPEDIKQSVAPK